MLKMATQQWCIYIVVIGGNIDGDGLEYGWNEWGWVGPWLFEPTLI